MANVRDLGQKIDSLGNMQKVMRAMNMIASIRLRKLIVHQEALKRYDASLADFADRFCRVLEGDKHFLYAGPPRVAKAHAVVFTADKGLCGAHNNSVHKALDLLVSQNFSSGVTTETSCLGNKGGAYARRKEYDIFHQTEINEKVLTLSALRRLADTLVDRYFAGKIQRLYLVYNVFISTIHQETRISRILPLKPEKTLLAFDKTAPGADRDEEKKEKLNAHVEPGPQPGDFAEEAARLYVFYRLRSALMNSTLSEQASRMTAMENASNNSKNLIDRYVALQNRARQASITNELIEIISGKEALKKKGTS